MPKSDERDIIKEKQQQLQQYQLQQALQHQQQYIVQDQQQQQTTQDQQRQNRRSSQQQQRRHQKKNSSISKIHEKTRDSNNFVYDIQDSYVVSTSSAPRSIHKSSLSQSSHSTYSSGQPLLKTSGQNQQLQNDYIPNDYNMSRQQQQQQPYYNHPYNPAGGDKYKPPVPQHNPPSSSRHQYPPNLTIDTTGAASSSRGQWNAQTPESTASTTKSYGYAIPGGGGVLSTSQEEDSPYHRQEASYERQFRRMREEAGQHEQIPPPYQQRPLSSQHPNPNDTRPLSPSSNTIGTMESGGRAGDRYKLLEDDNAMSSFENDQQYLQKHKSQQQQRRQKYNEQQQQQRPSSSRSGRARRTTKSPRAPPTPTTPNTLTSHNTSSHPNSPRLMNYFKNGSISTEESGMFGSFETSIIDTIGDNDVFYVKQKYAYFSIVLSIIQLLVMMIMMALCGVAPLDVNPMVGPYPDTLSYWGGKNAYLMTEEGEFWRFISPIMLHAGVIHLFCNVAVQLETGAFFEREWGSVIWVIVYVTAAIGSTVTSCLSRPNSISVGSSGALMGLFGAKLSEVYCISCFTMSRRGVFKGYNIHMEQLGGVLCSVAIVSLFSFIPFVDWAGHMGGLCTGFSVGMIIFSFQIESKRYRILWGFLGSLFLITFMISCFWYLYAEVYPDEELGDVCEYYRQIFYEGYECACQVQ